MINKIAFTIPIGEGFNVYWYGVIIAAAVLVAVTLGTIESKRRGYRSEMVLDFMLLAIPLGILFARLYYVVFSDIAYNSIIDVIAIWNGGLAIYGAVIGGSIAAVIFSKWRKVPLGELFDIAAPSIIIAQAIGRWGNFVNQEAHGVLITSQNWQWFPAGVNIGGQWFMATFFYESVWNLIIFAVLMLIRKKMKVRGGVFALYVALYGFGRFFIEALRTDSLFVGEFRVSQLLSAALVVAGILYIVLMSRKKKEWPAYEGFYSINLSLEQIEEYRESMKKTKTKKDKDETETDEMKESAEKEQKESKKVSKKNKDKKSDKNEENNEE
ncbi:MAG: prolipoprotein diacylglyceryl transferase [Christensenellales bacterium]